MPIRAVRAQPGPQEQLLACSADIAVYGGQAGGGKSFGILLDAGRWTQTPGFDAVIFRRTTPQLKGAASLWAESHKLYQGIGGRPRENVLDWHFPSGATIEFSHLQYESTVYDWQGKGICGLYVDEATHLTGFQFWYMQSRNRSVCGVRPYTRATCNPDPDSFVRELIDWWIAPDGYPVPERSGVLRWCVREDDELLWGEPRELWRRYRQLPAPRRKRPLSVTFIPSTLDDNPALLEADPGYRDRLNMVVGVDRERLSSGNWNIRPAPGDYFKPQWFPRVKRLQGKVVGAYRGWDKAATEVQPGKSQPDWSRGICLLRLVGAPYRWALADLQSLQGSPGEVNALMLRTARRDGYATTVCVWQDPGAAGKFDVAQMRELLSGFELRSRPTSKSKTTYAAPFSSECEAGDVALLDGPWVPEFFRELEAFPSADVHDDIVDACSIAYMVATQQEGLHGELDVGGEMRELETGSGWNL